MVWLESVTKKIGDTSELTKYFPEIKSRIPIRKPRGKNLKKKEKRYNHKLGKERVVIERTIGKMKKVGIMGKGCFAPLVLINLLFKSLLEIDLIDMII
ncbi:MAG: transposase family protein [Halobacteriota archaeon]|nr:transposase family protein [Halobacteriota archaeon]